MQILSQENSVTVAHNTTRPQLSMLCEEAIAAHASVCKYCTLTFSF